MEALLKDAEHGAADDEGGSLRWPVVPVPPLHKRYVAAGGWPTASARTDTPKEAETPTFSKQTCRRVLCMWHVCYLPWAGVCCNQGARWGPELACLLTGWGKFQCLSL